MQGFLFHFNPRERDRERGSLDCGVNFLSLAEIVLLLLVLKHYSKCKDKL